ACGEALRCKRPLRLLFLILTMRTVTAGHGIAMNIQQLLQERLGQALTGLVPDPAPYVAMLKPAQDARFGDYQANCAMSLAKVLGKKPREIAQEVVQQLPQSNLLQPAEIAGPGFINLRFRTGWLAARLRAMAQDERLGIGPA